MSIKKRFCRGILCDFDGVLGITGEDNYIAWTTILKPLGINLDREEYFLCEGKSSPQLLTEILLRHSLSIEQIPSLIERKQAYYSNNNSFRFYEGTEDLIKLAQKNNIKLAVVSGGSQRRLSHPEALRVIGKFDAVITASDSAKTKPSPEPYLVGARKLNLSPDHCLVIENAPLGIASALAADMFCIAVSTTLDRKHLAKANVIVDTLADVLPIIEELCL